MFLYGMKWGIGIFDFEDARRSKGMREAWATDCSRLQA